MKKVMVFGTFDIVHQGHLNMLWQARGLGDHLTVVIARDSTVKKLKHNQAMNSEAERKMNIKRLRIADRVVLGSTGPNKYRVIKQYKPDIIALGYDQKYFTDKLSTLNINNKKLKIVILKSYKPKVYKTSIIKNLLNKKSVQ
jgi:FAD synthetase